MIAGAQAEPLRFVLKFKKIELSLSVDMVEFVIP
jgi:hypothetical protein